MVIRLEFLVDDLRKSILDNATINPLIVKAWREYLEFRLKNGQEVIYKMLDGMEINIYNLYCIDEKDDLIRAIENGTTAEDIHDVVNATCQGKSSYFTKDKGCLPYVFTIEDLKEIMYNDVADIAYNILYFPYKPIFGELYKMFVVPMLDNQK